MAARWAVAVSVMSVAAEAPERVARAVAVSALASAAAVEVVARAVAVSAAEA